MVDGTFLDRSLFPMSPASEEGLLGCACGARFPVVDGIPVVLRDLSGWIASELPEVVRRHDLPEGLRAWLGLHAGGSWARNEALLSVYEASREGPLQARLRGLVEGLSGDILEMGAGLGSTSREDVVALDTNLSLLRRHPGRGVCGDAADPPFSAGAFDAVVLPNLLDSCQDPPTVLAQAAALLRPGGTLLLSCAFAFQDAITPLARRFDAEGLLSGIKGSFFGYFLGMTVEVAEDRIPWPLQLSARTRHVHEALLVVARKGV